MTKQPRWRFLANMGDASPIDYGGFFVYRDVTRQYPEEAEVLLSPDSDGADGWTVYRFSLDRLRCVEDAETHTVHLVPDGYDLATWPHALSQYDEWFHASLAGVAAYAGYPVAQLRADLCNADPLVRARAYQTLGEYHGWDNFDGYPVTLTKRSEVNARYRSILRRRAPRTVAS